MRCLVWVLAAAFALQAHAGTGSGNQSDPRLECTQLALDRSIALQRHSNIPLTTAELIRELEVPGGRPHRKLHLPIDPMQEIIGQPDTSTLRGMLREAYLAKYFVDQWFTTSSGRTLPRYQSIYFASNSAFHRGDAHSLVYGNPPAGVRTSRRMCVDVIAHDAARDRYSIGEAKGRDILHAVHQIHATIAGRRHDGSRWINGLSRLDDVVIVTCETDALPRYFSVSAEGNLQAQYYGRWVEVLIYEKKVGEYGVFPPQLEVGFDTRKPPPLMAPPSNSIRSKPIRMIFTHGDADEPIQIESAQAS